jgi:flagellar protein FlaG
MDTTTSLGGNNGTFVPTVQSVGNVKSTSAEEGQIQNVKELKKAELEGKYIPISEAQLVKAIDRAIKAMEGTTTTLDFSIHQETKRIIVKVLDKNSGELLKEIPHESSLDFLAKLWDMTGILMDERR